MTRQGGVGVSTGTTGVLGKAVTKPWENGWMVLESSRGDRISGVALQFREALLQCCP